MIKILFLKSILTLAALSSIVGVGYAQASQETPAAVAKAYVAATLSGDWTKASSFMHPDSVSQLKKVFEPMFANEKAAKAVGPLFGIKSRAEFDQINGAQMFEKLMNGIVGAMPGFNKLMNKTSFTIIGQIAETPDLIHLVYRTQVPLDDLQLKGAPKLTKNVTFAKMELMTLKRYENTWRLILPGELEAMAQMFANIFAAAAAEEDKGAPSETPSTPAEKGNPARKS